MTEKLIPTIRHGNATAYETESGRPIIIENGRRTEYRDAEQCFRALHRRRS